MTDATPDSRQSEPADTPAADAGPDQDLIYFGDPMCSWCYGFAPALDALRQDFGDRLPIRPVMGGLRAGNTDVMGEEQRETIRGHWGHVSERSGQPFDYSFFEREGFIYDTAPACLAVVTARGLSNDEAAIDFMHLISRAFYAHNTDITEPQTLVGLAQGAGFDGQAFAQTFASEPAWNALVDDLKLTQQAGIQGFPTVVGRKGQQFWLITHGYQGPEALREAVDAWLAEVGAPAPA